MTLQDAIGRDVFIFDNIEYTDKEFMNMSSEDIETFKARVNLKIFNTIDLIRQRKKLETVEWRRRKEYVISVNNKILPYLNAVLKQRRKTEKTISDHFMDQAKIILPVNDFEAILSCAGKEMRLREG